MTVQRRSHRLAALAAALLVAGLSGCSGEARGSAGTARHCVAVSDDVLAQIAVGAAPGKPLALAAGAAVKARAGVYVVAARVSGEKGAVAIGVWTVAALHGTAAPILVADETASARSTWSTVEEFPHYGVALDSPTIATARACLQG